MVHIDEMLMIGDNLQQVKENLEALQFVSENLEPGEVIHHTDSIIGISRPASRLQDFANQPLRQRDQTNMSRSHEIATDVTGTSM